MNEPKHTPGPWPNVFIQRDKNIGVIEVRPRLKIVVDHREDLSDPTPDTYLIAAAPDLLAALEDMVHYDDLPAHEQQPAVERARAAIAKAQGGE